jgi:uncharacterized protein (DUF305 family)
MAKSLIGLAVSAALCGLPVLSAAQDGKKAQSTPSRQMHQSMVKGAKESMAMKPSGDIDRDFVTMMSHHHQTGIRMAEHELLNGKDPQVKELAQKILEGQTQEKKELDQLKASLSKPK